LKKKGIKKLQPITAPQRALKCPLAANRCMPHCKRILYGNEHLK